MSTNRQLFFNNLNKNNKYLTRLVIKSMLNFVNDFNDEISLYKHFDEECKNEEKFLEMISRIEKGEPFQYVLGFANFIDRDFEVNSNVLIPRQETEELVIDTKTIIEQGFEKKNITIADIGTGSGCIAITLKRFFPESRVIAIDIDDKCIEVAKRNAKKHKTDVEFLQGDMVQPLLDKDIKVDLIISNPPYIGSEETIDEQVLKYEPHKALLAHPKTKYYEELFKNASKLFNNGVLMCLEIGEDMVDELDQLICKYIPGANYYFVKDMYKKMRFLYIIEQGDNSNA